jgi:hypothetical protein
MSDCIEALRHHMDMDSPAWFNIATLVIAVSAMGISSAFTVRALRLSRNANHLPVVTNLLAPHRDPAFLEKEDYVNAHIGDHDPAAGFQGLPEPIRSFAFTVCQQYQLLGYLSRYNLADERILAAQVRYNALRTWAAVEPHVRGERQLRGGEFTFLNSFEEFMRGAQEMDPQSEMAWQSERHPAWRRWRRLKAREVRSA